MAAWRESLNTCESVRMNVSKHAHSLCALCVMMPSLSSTHTMSVLQQAAKRKYMK